MKIQKITRKDQSGYVGFLFYCPGCKRPHYVNTVAGGPLQEAVWQHDGDYEKPTVSPSLLVRAEIKCHLFLRAGVLQFLNDCDHELAGKHVPLPDFPEDY